MKYTNKLKPATRADSAQMLRMLNGSGVVQRTTTQRDTIRINFTAKGIGTADEHLEELESIRSASPEDIIVLYFTDAPGGCMGTGQSIINALMETPAHTVAVLEGHNCSLATMVPLICREIIVTPYTSMMLHSVSGGAYGTMVNQERQAMFFSKLYSDFIEDVYDGFLSPEEIQDLKNGLEIYLNSEEIEERLQRRAELLAAEAEEECGCGACVDKPDDIESFIKRTKAVGLLSDEMEQKIREGLDDTTTFTSEEVGEKVKETLTEEAKKRAPAKKKPLPKELTVFKQGMKVRSLQYGEGVVDSVSDGDDDEVHVIFDNGMKINFTLGGIDYNDCPDGEPTLEVVPTKTSAKKKVAKA